MQFASKTDNDGLWSRETLAGYDPAILHGARVLVVGGGALGTNLCQTLGLLGVPVYIIDFDTVEPSNLSRNPLVRADRFAGSKPRYKATEVARAICELSPRSDSTAHYATLRVEDVGLGVFRRMNVVVAAVDNKRARRDLANATRLLGLTLVEGGLLGHAGNVSVYPNNDDPACAPCWSCTDPEGGEGGISCATYARQVVAGGRAPATQPAAATVAGLMAEATIAALHGDVPLAHQRLHVNVRTGETGLIELSRDPECPGVHRRWAEVEELGVRSDEPVSRIFEAIASTVEDPVLHLPRPFLIEAPCGVCGGAARMDRPADALSGAPRCKECKPGSRPGEVRIITSIRPGDEAARRLAKRVGLPPLAIFEVEDRATGAVRAYELAGSLDDIFTTVSRARATPLAR